MALTESIEYDKIEVVGIYKHVQVRKATIIKRDGEEIAGSRSYDRYILECGSLDGTDANNFVDNPLDKEPDGVTVIPDEVKVICNAVWTDSIKTAYKAVLIAKQNESLE